MAETTSLERVRTVLTGGIPDRVPVCLLSFQNAARLAGYNVGEYCQDGAKMAAAQLAYWEVFRHDVIDIESGIAATAEAIGCEVAYSEDAPPWVTRPAIHSLDEVGWLPDIDPERAPSLAELLKATRLVAARLGDHVCIRGESDLAPFSLAAQLLGMENFLLALTDPEQADGLHRLLAYTTEQVARLAKAQIAAGSHYTLIGDSTAGPDVCSPAMYRRFAWPYEWRLIETLRPAGVQVGIHICGNATSIINDMIQSGAPYFELDYKIDRAAVKRATASSVTVFGTLDPSGLLPFGTPDQVTVAAREDMQLLGEGGRYVLSPGCTLPYDTPFENIAALVKAAHEYGRYGPEGRLVL
jgi:uroporphyrinogen decarboxylase